MSLRYNYSPVTGTADTLVAGSVITGNTLLVNDGNRQKVFNLSALVNLDVETSTLTMSSKWQVSPDGSTWTDIANGTQNAAAVVLGTGTAGADASILKVLPAPDAVYGFKFARCSLVTGVTTGAAVDTYSLGYNLSTRPRTTA